MAARSPGGTAPLKLTLRAANRSLAKLKPISVQCQYRVNSIPWMEIVLSAEDGDPGSFKDEVSACLPGNTFRLATEEGALFFDGIVARLSRRTGASRSELTLHVRHPLQKLASMQRSQVFEQLTDSAIVSSICSAQGIRVAGTEGLTIRHPQMVQFQCSDWHFMRARVKANAAWIVVQPDTLRIALPKLAPTADHTLRWAQRDTQGGASPQADVDDAFWRFDVTELASGITMSGWDLRQQKSVSVKAETMTLGRGALDARRLKTLGSGAWSSARSTALQPGELAALARATLQDQHLNGAIARFVVVGSLSYGVGQTLELSGFGDGFDGSGIITGVEHFLVQGAWRTTLDLGVDDAWSEFDTSGVPAVSGTHVGVVEAFQRDPDGLDRFRVRIPALIEDNKPLWARFSTPYAGEAHGLYLYPEVGDEVSVTFFDHDPRYPVITNAMFNPKNPPPVAAGASGPRALVFDSQKKRQLLFDGQSGALTLQAGDDTVILDQGIALTSNKEIKADGPALGLSASKKVEVQGKSGVSIKGPKIEMDS